MSAAPNLPQFHRYRGPTPLPVVVVDSAIDALKVFEYKEGDVLIATYPKCGTHWMNEVVQLILHEGDPTQLDFRHRRTCLELKDVRDLSKHDQVKPTIELVEDDSSPRVLMTHLGPSYLSEQTWKKRIPIIYVFRDPRDVAISEYKFLGDFLASEGQALLEGVPFDMFLETFISEEVAFGSWCDHALAYERIAARGENILFVTYEDMKKDLTAVIKSVANHIGREVSDELIAKAVANSTVEAMRKNYQEAAKGQNALNVNLSTFVKTGVAGRWKTEVSEEKWKKLHEIFKEKVKDTVHAKRYFHD